MSKKTIITLKCETKTIKVLLVENGTYKNKYFELQSNRRRICAPFGFTTLTEAANNALEMILLNLTQTLGDC